MNFILVPILHSYEPLKYSVKARRRLTLIYSLLDPSGPGVLGDVSTSWCAMIKLAIVLVLSNFETATTWSTNYTQERLLAIYLSSVIVAPMLLASKRSSKYAGLQSAAHCSYEQVELQVQIWGQLRAIVEQRVELQVQICVWVRVFIELRVSAVKHDQSLAPCASAMSITITSCHNTRSTAATTTATAAATTS